MRVIRSLFRILAFLWLCGLTTCYIFLGLAWRRMRKRSRDTQRVWIQKHFVQFVHRTHRIMGMRIQWEGDLPQQAAVIMGNHRSYADAILFPVQLPVAFVARKESKSWPIIGWGATVIGTIWVDRKDKNSRRNTRLAVRERLSEGTAVILFPEGTTHLGPDLLEYRPGMFYTCAEEGFAVVPVALEYRDPNIAWVGNTWFIPHAFRHFGARHIDVAVRFGEPMTASDGETLRTQVRDWTAKHCLDLRARFDAEGTNN